MQYLPKIITAKYGLRECIENLYRESIPMRDKQSGIYYLIENNEAIFYNRRTGENIAKYIHTFDNKYKKVNYTY